MIVVIGGYCIVTMVLPVFLKKKMLFCSLKNEHLQELMHGKIISSPNKKIITNATPNKSKAAVS